MTARNDVTGDAIISKSTTEKFRTGWNLIDWSDKVNPSPSQDKCADAFTAQTLQSSSTPE